jgi:hypothetical protein
VKIGATDPDTRGDCAAAAAGVATAEAAPRPESA